MNYSLTTILEEVNLQKISTPINGVDLYSCPLGNLLYNSPEINFLASQLTASELVKVNHYKFPYLQANAIISRAILRILLSFYLKTENTQQIKIFLTQYGKPYIEKKLYFSIAHCDKRLLLAITRHFPLGVDIEDNYKKIELETAIDVLADEELKNYSAMSMKLKYQQFLIYWTRKEAYLKAIGKGLINDLKSVDTTHQEVKYLGKSTGISCYNLTVDKEVTSALAIPY